MKKKYNSSKHSSIKFILQTKKERKVSNVECNLNDKYLLTTPEISNHQKLLNFISDKKKLTLKSYFDHRGTKAFLNGKNEAMKKISLNESLEEDTINEKTTKKKHKKFQKMRSVAFLKTKNNNGNLIINSEFTKEIQKERKKNFSTAKPISNSRKNKKNSLDEISNGCNLDNSMENEQNSPLIKTKKEKPKSILKNRLAKKKEQNINKSINSILTVDSTLFNNKKDYNNYKRLPTKEDIPIIEDILNELGVNKK